jgi:hypothetical protein
MIRVRNAHGALCNGIEPGAEGEVDETRPGVQVHLRAGLLLAVLDAAPDGPPADSGPPAQPAESTDTATPTDATETPAEGRRARRNG